jgi:hypothetical protein
LKHLEALEMLENVFQAFQGLQDVSRVDFSSRIKGIKRFKQFDVLLMYRGTWTGVQPATSRLDIIREHVYILAHT